MQNIRIDGILCDEVVDIFATAGEEIIWHVSYNLSPGEKVYYTTVQGVDRRKLIGKCGDFDKVIMYIDHLKVAGSDMGLLITDGVTKTEIEVYENV